MEMRSLRKELNKLVAVMTLLQGLTELNAALKEKDAIATALQTGAGQKLQLLLKMLGTLQYLKELLHGINLKNVSDTEEFLKDKAPAFLQMLDLKAKATAALALATDEYKKILNAQSKSEDDYVSTTDVVLQGIKSSLNIFRSQSSTFIAATTALSKTAETNRKKEVDDAQKSYDILLKMANGFFDQANQIANKNDFVVKPKVDLNALEKALQDAYNFQKAYLEQFADFFKRDADNEKNGYDARLHHCSLLSAETKACTT
jgi:hypothetical protein